MGAILKIALRNVFAHKVKTAIVGFLIFLGIFLMVIGNSFLDSTSQGIEKAYSQSVSGDIAILKAIDFDYSLFGTWTDVGNLRVPMMPDIEETRAFVSGLDEVESVTAVSSSFLVIDNPLEDNDYWINAIAVDPVSYQEFFQVDDTLILHEGRFLEEGEEGILLSKAVVDYFLEYKNMELHAGDTVMLNGYSSNGFRIREIPIRGIMEFNYVKGDMYDMLPRTCLIDQQTFNLLNGFTVSQPDEEDSPLIDEFLFLESEDDLFGSMGDITITEGLETMETDLNLLLGDMSERHTLSQVDPKDWQWMLVRLKNPTSRNIRQFRQAMVEHFEEDFSTFEAEDFLRPLTVAEQILEGDQPHFQNLRDRLDSSESAELQNHFNSQDEAATAVVLADIFQGWLTDKDLYQEESFEAAYFGSITKNLLDSDQRGFDLIRRNRLMLEELFPHSMMAGPDYTVSEWWHASAPMSTTTVAIQWVMNIGLVILFIVAIIIIMNTLVISVMERTGEIGTIRAMGGQKSFVTRLFITETLMISFLFGTIGFLAGWLVIAILGGQGIPAPDGSMLQMIAGGNHIYPKLSLWTIGFSTVFMLVVGLVSCIYPLNLAMKIQPVEAMRD